MIDTIKAIKEGYLNTLKEKKAELESKKVALVEQKYAEKKIAIDAENQILDDTLAQAISQKQAKLNEEVAELRQEVADKKAEKAAKAQAEAEAEAEKEINYSFKEFDEEIAKLEKELA